MIENDWWHTFQDHYDGREFNARQRGGNNLSTSNGIWRKEL